MKNINIPFSLYDFFAILLPGFAGIFGIYLLIDPGLNFLKQNQNLANIGEMNEILILTGLMVLSYFVGHLLNAFSEVLIDKPANAILGWPANRFLANLGLLVDKGVRGFTVKNGRLKFPKRIYEWNESGSPSALGEVLKSCIEKQFGSIHKEWSYTYTLIRAYVNENLANIASDTKVFSANSAMFASLSMAAILICIAFLKGILAGQISQAIFWPDIIITIILTLMFFISYRRYKRLWVESLYAGFMMSVKSGIKPENKGKQ